MRIAILTALILQLIVGISHASPVETGKLLAKRQWPNFNWPKIEWPKLPSWEEINPVKNIPSFKPPSPPQQLIDAIQQAIPAAQGALENAGKSIGQFVSNVFTQLSKAAEEVGKQTKQAYDATNIKEAIEKATKALGDNLPSADAAKKVAENIASSTEGAQKFLLMVVKAGQRVSQETAGKVKEQVEALVSSGQQITKELLAVAIEQGTQLANQISTFTGQSGKQLKKLYDDSKIEEALRQAAGLARDAAPTAEDLQKVVKTISSSLEESRKFLERVSKEALESLSEERQRQVVKSLFEAARNGVKSTSTFTKEAFVALAKGAIATANQISEGVSVAAETLLDEKKLEAGIRELAGAVGNTAKLTDEQIRSVAKTLANNAEAVQKLIAQSLTSTGNQAGTAGATGGKQASELIQVVQEALSKFAEQARGTSEEAFKQVVQTAVVTFKQATFFFEKVVETVKQATSEEESKRIFKLLTADLIDPDAIAQTAVAIAKGTQKTAQDAGNSAANIINREALRKAIEKITGPNPSPEAVRNVIREYENGTRNMNELVDAAMEGTRTANPRESVRKFLVPFLRSLSDSFIKLTDDSLTTDPNGIFVEIFNQAVVVTQNISKGIVGAGKNIGEFFQKQFGR